MALTANTTYQTRGHVEHLHILAGDTDELYEGAIVNIGTDGFIKVAADVANEVPIGVMKKAVSAAGSNAETCEIVTGIIRLAHTGAAQTDVGAFFYATADDTLADSATNVGPLGLCVDFETGFVWIDTRIKALS